MSWVLDLDGVVWRGDVAIDGAPGAIAELHSREVEVFYATNNSAMRASEYVSKLARFNIAANEDSIIHGGHALASLVEAGEKVLLCAGDGVREALVAKGIEVIDADSATTSPPPVDCVAVAWTPDFDYRHLAIATRAVLAGARLLATNMDPLYPASDGFIPGTGALATAVGFATGQEITFSGKPAQPMTDIVRERAGNIELMVGDQPRTDGGLAYGLDVPFALVLTGVTQRDPVAREFPIDRVANDLKGVVESWFETDNA